MHLHVSSCKKKKEKRKIAFFIPFLLPITHYPLPITHKVRMTPKVGSGLYVRLPEDKDKYGKKGDFVHGFWLDHTETRVLVEHDGHSHRDNQEWYEMTEVFVFRHGTAKPVSRCLPPSSPSSPITRTLRRTSGRAGRSVVKKKKGRNGRTYNHRKVNENARLIHDVLTLGFDIKTANLLTLDDFPRSSISKKPVTTSTWKKHGGDVSRVHVPNPDPQVMERVNAMGAHGFVGTLGDMVDHYASYSSNDKNCAFTEPFDVLYIDLCGFFSSHQDQIEKLFRHHLLMMADEVLIHLTTCKREGAHVMENAVMPALEKWAEQYRYGRVAQLSIRHSSTMWKGAFLLRRTKRGA